MKLEEALLKIREENLTKTELENFRDQLAVLLAEFQLEMAQLEKLEALYMNGKGPDETAISRKIEGQRLIDLKRWASATKTMMTSLRDRLYNFY